MQVIPVKMVVDKNRICKWKKEGQGGGKAQGVADPYHPKKLDVMLACVILIKSVG
jgi:hypothetical protein